MNQFDLEDFENLVLSPQSSFEKPLSLQNQDFDKLDCDFKEIGANLYQKQNQIVKASKNSNLSIQQVISIGVQNGNGKQHQNKVDSLGNQSNLCQNNTNQLCEDLEINILPNESNFKRRNDVTPKRRNEPLSRWTSLEKRIGLISDPLLDEKQQLFVQLYELIQKIGVSSAQKKHSILEDVLQLCIIYLPDIRGSQYQLFNQMLYLEFQEQFNLQRTFEGFKRRFHHLSLFANCWTIDNLQKILTIISTNQSNQFLQQYCIEYDIIKTDIHFPSLLNQKKSSQKNSKVISQIIQKSEKKKIVLSMTTKIIVQNMDLQPKEIDEDIVQFEDEIDFVEMLLKLIEIVK